MNDQFQSLLNPEDAPWIVTDTSGPPLSLSFSFWDEEICTCNYHRATSGICQAQFFFSSVAFERRRKPVYMTDTKEGLPMDVAKDARCQQEEEQQQQQKEQKEELDRNDSVRARLLAISQAEPVGDVVPLDAIKEVKESPQASPTGDKEDEFRRKLMAISYTDVPLPAQ